VLDEGRSLTALERCLSTADVRNARGVPLLVRDENALRGHGGRSYESRILEHGVIAVRPGSWHDVFNVLVWRTFPRAKAALNECHCAELRRDPDAPRPGPCPTPCREIRGPRVAARNMEGCRR
jgi:hypothetical protein